MYYGADAVEHHTSNGRLRLLNSFFVGGFYCCGAMKKHYFQHDEEARNDEKITQLRLEHGAYGYGIYWMIIEAMHRGNGEITDIKAFAFSINENFTKLESVVKTCLRVALLDPTNNGGIKSNRVINQIAQRDEYIEKQREFGRIGGLKKAKNLGNPKATSSDKRKGKETKVKETTNVSAKMKSWIANNGVESVDGYIDRMTEDTCDLCVEKAWKKFENGRHGKTPSAIFTLASQLHEKH